jgi:hypothetical protein
MRAGVARVWDQPRERQMLDGVRQSGRHDQIDGVVTWVVTATPCTTGLRREFTRNDKAFAPRCAVVTAVSGNSDFRAVSGDFPGHRSTHRLLRREDP